MKIIMNGIKNDAEARQSFFAVKKAIQEGIKEGRHNFKIYDFQLTSISVSVCKNKGSFTTYIQDPPSEGERR